MVRVRFEPSKRMSSVHKVDSNWRPLSVVTVEGTPKRAIQLLVKARATVSAVMSAIGIGFGPPRESIYAGEDLAKSL